MTKTKKLSYVAEWFTEWRFKQTLKNTRKNEYAPYSRLYDKCKVQQGCVIREIETRKDGLYI